MISPLLRTACLSLLLAVATADALTVDSLRCEALTQPPGVDTARPRLSWLLQSPERGARQTAYQILVASSSQILARNQGDLWDSGRVTSADTFNIEYAGQPLHSETRCFWKVKAWDQDARDSGWSAPANWSEGLLDPADWKARWIGFEAPPAAHKSESSPAATPAKPKPLVLPPPAQVRTTFQTTQKIANATLHVAALGLADVYLNGRRVNDDYFGSGWTDYNKRVYTRSYDVTGLLRAGENALGAIVADGWYSGYVGFRHERGLYGKRPRVGIQLHIRYTDGSDVLVTTGADWKGATGALRQADLLMGETYDARAEQTGWAQAGFDDRSWSPVQTGATVAPIVQPHPGPPVIAIAEFKAKTITEPSPGVYILDMGQNFAGVARLKITGTSGQKIILRHGERLTANGALYTANLRSARATDTYICRGGGEEIWQPRFTYHGFQYIEVTGLSRRPGPDTVTGIALGSDTPVAGAFTCSDPMLNKLHNNIYWTQRMNFIDIPTDCPQRDERLGWLGDAQIYIRTATLNADVQAFFTKWLVDLADSQSADGQFPKVAPLKIAGGDAGPAWSDAGVICPWTIYETYGDKRVLEKYYAGMTRFIGFCLKRDGSGLLPSEKYHVYGDWLNINAETPKGVISLAYFALSTRLTAQAAEVLGKTEDAARYRALFGQIRETFNREFVAADGRIKGDTQACYALAIAYDLLDEEKARQAADHLVANIESRGWHLSTGFVGTKDLMLALAKAGRNDVACRLAQTDTFPSWGFSIKNGATSIWERWNGWTPEKGFFDPGMNSFAHYSYGAVYQWMVENLGGIKTDGPAYQHIVIAPQPGGTLTEAATRYDGIRGRIETSWKKHNGRFDLAVTIPPNTNATIHVPADDPATVTEGGRPAGDVRDIRFLGSSGHAALYSVPSGTYAFSSAVKTTSSANPLQSSR